MLTQHEKGDWQGLSTSGAEVMRYKILARLIQESHPHSVLDIGCGEAALRKHIPTETSYLGIESSLFATEWAVINNHASVLNMTVEDFESHGRLWDCVVVSEMLYYCSDPLAVLEKFSAMLTPSGLLVISIYQKPRSFSDRLLFRTPPNLKCTVLVKDFLRSWNILYENQIEQWKIWSAQRVK